MRYNPLGRTGLFVSELCLGTMTFGGSGGLWEQIGALGQDESERMIGTAIDAGINFIDTADVYGAGQSEEITGQALRNLGVRRESVVLATKVFGRMGAGPNDGGCSRGHIIDGVKASLKRMQLDHIDLLQLHHFDVATPVDEMLEGLDHVVRQGLARYVGVSNWMAWQVSQAIGIAERRGLARIASLQSYYSIAGRDLEREIAPMLKAEQVGLMIWSPLAGGYLSGKYSGGADSAGRRKTFAMPEVVVDRADAVIALMRTMAEPRGVSVAQVALAWLLHQPHVTSVIVGVRRPDQLADNIGSTRVALTADELARLDEVSRLPSEYPGWMQGMFSGFRQELLNPPPRDGA